MEIGKASNLPGAGCPGLPGLNANSRPGAGCPGKPPHRYICEYIHLQWKSKVGGGSSPPPHVLGDIMRSTISVMDTLPEWSKGVDSSSTSASCVGSNPTGVIVQILSQ